MSIYNNVLRTDYRTTIQRTYNDNCKRLESRR